MKMKFLIPNIVIQSILILILFHGDIGFDKPGKYGLSFEEGIFISICLINSIIYVFFKLIKERKWKLLLTELYVPVIVIVLSLIFELVNN